MDDGFTFKFDDASHAGYARKLFVHYLGGQVSADTDLFGVEMVFGELIGNVARHAPGSVEVRLRWQGDAARLEVIDEGAGYERCVLLPDAMEEFHRGLFLVASFGDDLSVETRGGKTVTGITLKIRRAALV
jgi:anti-sigma regulatory factor (Ser/Thr protein kinase)